jgi:hypothetical protein
VNTKRFLVLTLLAVSVLSLAGAEDSEASLDLEGVRFL